MCQDCKRKREQKAAEDAARKAAYAKQEIIDNAAYDNNEPPPLRTETTIQPQTGDSSPVVPFVVESVAAYEVDGVLRASLMPCPNCGEIIDMASDTCSCWQDLPELTDREQADKKQWLAEYLSERLRGAIRQGRPLMTLDVLAYHQPRGENEAEREANWLENQARHTIPTKR